MEKAASGIWGKGSWISNGPSVRIGTLFFSSMIHFFSHAPGCGARKFWGQQHKSDNKPLCNIENAPFLVRNSGLVRQVLHSQSESPSFSNATYGDSVWVNGWLQTR